MIETEVNSAESSGWDFGVGHRSKLRPGDGKQDLWGQSCPMRTKLGLKNEWVKKWTYCADVFDLSGQDNFLTPTIF